MAEEELVLRVDALSLNSNSTQENTGYEVTEDNSQSFCRSTTVVPEENLQEFSRSEKIVSDDLQALTTNENVVPDEHLQEFSISEQTVSDDLQTLTTNENVLEGNIAAISINEKTVSDDLQALTINENVVSDGNLQEFSRSEKTVSDDLQTSTTNENVVPDEHLQEFSISEKTVSDDLQASTTNENVVPDENVQEFSISEQTVSDELQALTTNENVPEENLQAISINEKIVSDDLQALTTNENVPEKSQQANSESENVVPRDLKTENIISERKQENTTDELIAQESSPCNVVTSIINNLLECVESISLSQTGIVYDKRMMSYQCKGVSMWGTHPERPARIRHIYQKLCEENLINRCKMVEARLATRNELLTKHTIEHIKFIGSLKDRDEEELEKLASGFNSIYLHRNVSESALLSAGCTIALMEEVITGKLLNGVAVVRPPGHHALNHCSMGFCHFNNVAVAAMVAIQRYNLSRILIVDWDVHYGNGTHKMFESDPRVLFFSMHRYDHGTFWPTTKEANYDAVGINEGEGFNIHVAWNCGKMGDPEYLLAFEKILLPVAQEYKPELVIVSSGFDSGEGDPLGGCSVTPAGYAHMTRQLMNLADGKLILVLEGGYNLNTISNSMAACVSTLLNDKLPELTINDVDPIGVESIKNTYFIMQKYWQCLLNDDLVDFKKYEKHEESWKSRLTRVFRSHLGGN